MESDVENPEKKTIAVFISFIVGEHIADFFTFSSDGSLTIESSPIGLDVQKGDVIVRYFGSDVRGWTQKEFESKHWLNLNDKTKVELLIFRKGYNPKDMDKKVKVGPKKRMHGNEYIFQFCILFSCGGTGSTKGLSFVHVTNAVWSFPMPRILPKTMIV